MRSLSEYPITNDEILQTLLDAEKKASTVNGEIIIGTVEPFILRTIRENLERNPSIIETIFKDDPYYKSTQDSENNVEEDDAFFSESYYMQEGHAMFAVALSRLKPGGSIFILSNINEPPFSEDYDLQFTHVFYKHENNCYDAKGKRSVDEMKADLLEGEYDLIEIKTPDYFMSKFMGNSPEKPLYGDEKEVQIAINFIRKSPHKYNISEPGIELGI